ncbi:hypothetical protein FS749_001712 [Ceratobasidium sp. UAMH 11750]|nr:hypothetical protein FS749_001712 [Ceratobasidium sp. UAMH 11750]
MSQRSLGATVDLSISVRKGFIVQKMATMTEATLAGLVSMLAPLALRTYRLRISSNVYAGSELQPILACMVKLCTGGLLETFTVHAAFSPLRSTRIFSWENSRLIDAPTTDQLDNFIQPIRTLDLRGVFIPWDTGLYQGLTELSVRFTDTSRHMSCDQLAQILSVCPALGLLSLRNVYATCPHDASILHEPIYLERLQQLELRCTRPLRLVHFLQVLRPTYSCLAVKITLAHESGFVKWLRTFFEEKSMVTTLHVQPKIKTAWFAPLFKSLYRLSRLTLEDCDFADPDLVVFVRTEHYNRGTVPWPWLYELRLIGCLIDLEVLECLATSPFMERLRLFGCRVRGSNTGRLMPVTMSMFEPVFGSPYVSVSVCDDI